jgi:hypothetical protein
MHGSMMSIHQEIISRLIIRLSIHLVNYGNAEVDLTPRLASVGLPSPEADSWEDLARTPNKAFARTDREGIARVIS